jgi:hypothetical protein
MTAQSQGREFEKELAEEFGLQQIAGSGSVWHSKLDAKGNNARWSLKFTTNLSFPLTVSDIYEALEACYGPGGDGSTPIWAVRMEATGDDYIVMRKEDWAAFHMDDLKYINEDRPQVAARKAKAKVPELLRDNE